MSIAAYQEKIMASKHHDESSILSSFKNIHTHMPEMDFSFSNVYKELPFINNASLHEINENTIKFRATSLQLAVIHHCCETLIQSPMLTAGVIGKLTSIDTTSNIVSLGDFSYAEISHNKRMTVRVHLNKPINVLLTADDNKISGMMSDISFGGCRIISAAGLILEKSKSLILHLKMFHDNTVQLADIPISLLRSENDTKSNVYAATFNHTSEIDGFLSQFIFKHQHEIICELKEKKLPQGQLDYKKSITTLEESMTAVENSAAHGEVGTQPTILIIDDQPLNVTLLDAILRPAGYRTLKAFSGRDGRLLAVQEQPCMILLDITMPVEDGVTTCRITDITKIIIEDAALSSRILKLANSPMFGYHSEIDSISKAVTVIGTQQLRDMVMAASVMGAFNGIPDDVINMTSFWEHSIFCGIIARVLATCRREANVERFFLAGMLHDIGQLILCVKAPELVREMIAMSRESGKPHFIIQRSILGFDHGDVGGELLKRWKIPAIITEPVTCHHTPGRAELYPVETASMHAADVIGHAMQIGFGGEPFVPPLDERSWERLNIPVSMMATIMDQADAQLAEAMAILTGNVG